MKKKLFKFLYIFLVITLFGLFLAFFDTENENSKNFTKSPENLERFEDILSKFKNVTVFFFISGPRVITGIPYCSVMSAAKSHTDCAIIVFANGKMKQPKAWRKFENIFFIKLNESNILQNTPLLKWYSNDSWRSSQIWEYHLGDALRLAFLWKYGGLYLDNDVIVLKNIFRSFQNALAYENPEKSAVDGAVMIFRKFHPFVNLAMKKFVDEFRDEWAYQGPSLMKRTLDEYRSENRIRIGGEKNDSDSSVQVLNSTTFYPISWKNLEIKKMYRTKYKIEMEEKLKNSWAVHLWNKASKNFLIENGSALQDVINKICV